MGDLITFLNIIVQKYFYPYPRYRSLRGEINHFSNMFLYLFWSNLYPFFRGQYYMKIKLIEHFYIIFCVNAQLYIIFTPFDSHFRIGFILFNYWMVWRTDQHRCFYNIGYYSWNHWLQFYRFLKNSKVNETIREYDMKYLWKIK